MHYGIPLQESAVVAMETVMKVNQQTQTPDVSTSLVCIPYTRMGVLINLTMNIQF